ncbi:HAD family hydrolase [Corallincola luteus]|uniref:HAD family hydrolase n=1 Tax=Corallincola luteus TaxID=1775177 RepID=A0ABY2AM73_9GAMM|nr:HAD-IA family hydrolase [Corallincola luteus]TCI03320.1 HAD family hydrolase [Corallincola luteus]
MNVEGVLFDLDGTLLDTAPDLGAALNYLLVKENLSTLPLELIRPVASHGAKGLIDLGFGKNIDATFFAELRQSLLDYYSANICEHTNLFDGVAEILAELDAKHIPWGVVTNKPGWLTDPLLADFSEFSSARCIISGDTLPVRKPDPAPLFHAAELLGVAANSCIYVGDAERDIEAGRRAGMTTMLAAYGYIAEHDTPETWQADISVSHPDELSLWLLENLQGI